MQDPSAPEPSQIAFPVVGIGASAGGLAAMSELLSALPASTGMAFVLVQHLDPSHASMLAEILGKRTALPVAEARDGMALAPDRLYVIPANATLTVAGDTLRVGARGEDNRNPAPIDALFRSLAAERGRAAVGVLLSGASSDGTRGATEIKQAGGVVLAQEPESAAFATMPRSAIDAGAVDDVLRPAEIGQRLARLAEHLARGSGDPQGGSAAEDEIWKQVFRLLRGAGGIDFTHYKRSTIRRRVTRRQTLRHITDLGDYARLLSEDSAELHALAQDVLIGVTSFFRDPESFEALAQTVFPALTTRRAPRDPLRIWVPGCASGEELYSIAICLMEHLGERAPRTSIQFFGTDASDAAIARAREASYPEGVRSEVSPGRLERFFVKLDHRYRVAKPLRDLCVFARHDVTRDPPFSRVDLISCRNLLIYLDAGLQRQVIAQFHYALKPHGFLLLGPSEAIGASADLFELADKRRRVFRRREAPGHTHAQVARAPDARSAWLPEPLRAAPPEADRVQREADRLLLARYAPAAIAIDDELNVHQFRGDIGPYLAPASGAASLNLRQLAPPALRIALKPALDEARTARTAVRRENIRIDMHGASRSVSFEVSPFRMQDDPRRECYLVVFEQQVRRGLWERLLEAAARRAPAQGGAAGELEQARRELAATREFLQSSAEEHEATKEELKSLHEEALSSNEELQSTNEELETAKEELQSSNEELSTTNDELRARHQQLDDVNETLADARDFAEAIVATVRHPLLVLDGRLRVQSANAAFYRLFRVDPADTKGQLLYELGNHQWDIPDLRRLLEETLSKREAIEEYRVDHVFETLGERIMLLNARRLVGRKNESGLILLGIEDATERLNAKAALEDAERRKDEFLAMLGHELRNPLAPIRASLDIMRRMEIADETLLKCTKVLERQTEQMIRLVDDLLEMSRIASGKLQMEVADMQLGDALARSLEATRSLIEVRRHRLSVEQAARPLYVRGDLVRLTQIFTNLLNNAAKYTPPGGEIAVALEAAGADAVVTVTDNGQGIAAAALPSVFEAFAHPAGHSRTGLGIGLSLARRLAEAHGGTIEAKSKGEGRGSTFIVRIPLGGPKTTAAAVAAATGPDLRGCRILIVDDNVDAAQTLEILLAGIGCEVRCTYDGSSALPAAEEFAPQVVLLDLSLPDTDGYEVLRRLRASPRIQPAVIALTGFGQSADVKRMEQHGFDRILRKPVAVEALQAAIASVWRSNANPRPG